MWHNGHYPVPENQCMACLYVFQRVKNEYWPLSNYVKWQEKLKQLFTLINLKNIIGNIVMLVWVIVQMIVIIMGAQQGIVATHFISDWDPIMVKQKWRHVSQTDSFIWLTVDEMLDILVISHNVPTLRICLFSDQWFLRKQIYRTSSQANPQWLNQGNKNSVLTKLKWNQESLGLLGFYTPSNLKSLQSGKMVCGSMRLSLVPLTCKHVMSFSFSSVVTGATFNDVPKAPSRLNWYVFTVPP